MATEDQLRYDLLAASMRTLVQSHEWEILCEELNKLEDNAIESLIHDPSPVRAGRIEGMRIAVHYPGEIIRASERLRREMTISA